MNFLKSAISSVRKNLSGDVSVGEATVNAVKSFLTKKIALTIAFPVIATILVFCVLICTLDQFGIKIELMQMVDTSSYSESGYGTDGGSNIGVSNSLAEAMVNLAVSQLNDSNALSGQKFWDYYGVASGTPWCAYFVSWVIANTEYNGQKLNSIIKSSGGACDAFMNEAKTNGGYRKNDQSYEPQPGDIIWFSWGNPICDHVGIVERYDKTTKQIITIEGNSSKTVKENSNWYLTSREVVAFYHWY